MMSWSGYVARMTDIWNEHKILFGKPERKLAPRRPRCGRDDNIKMDLIDIGWDVIDWTHLA